jgi:hypothetical protein
MSRSLVLAPCGDFGFLDVVERQRPGFHQSSHERFGTTVEQAEQLLNERGVGLVTGNRRVDDGGIADPLDATEGPFLRCGTLGCQQQQRVDVPPLLGAAVAKLPGRKILRLHRTRYPAARFLIETQYQLNRATGIAIGRVSP